MRYVAAVTGDSVTSTGDSVTSAGDTVTTTPAPAGVDIGATVEAYLHTQAIGGAGARDAS